MYTFFQIQAQERLSEALRPASRFAIFIIVCSFTEIYKCRQHELENDTEGYYLLTNTTNGNHVRDIPDAGIVHNKKSRNGNENDAVQNVTERRL
jgi:hypothetical protein